MVTVFYAPIDGRMTQMETPSVVGYYSYTQEGERIVAQWECDDAVGVVPPSNWVWHD